MIYFIQIMEDDNSNNPILDEKSKTKRKLKEN